LLSDVLYMGEMNNCLPAQSLLNKLTGPRT